MEYRLGCMRQHFIILILAIQVHNPYTRVCHWHIESVVRSCSSQWRGLSGIVLCLQLVFSVTVASQNEIWQSWIIAAYTKKICANLFLCLGNFSYLENIQASWFFCHQVCGYQNHTSKTVETKSKTIRPNRYFFCVLEFFPVWKYIQTKIIQTKRPFSTTCGLPITKFVSTLCCKQTYLLVGQGLYWGLIARTFKMLVKPPHGVYGQYWHHHLLPSTQSIYINNFNLLSVGVVRVP